MEKAGTVKIGIAGKDVNNEMLSGIAKSCGYPNEVIKLVIIDCNDKKFDVVQPRKDGNFVMIRNFNF